uniref:Uncharacterized protein n=1 Tax=Triticum urartu TaxID=4572 RepID=A0A8R7V719_TRIUA
MPALYAASSTPSSSTYGWYYHRGRGCLACCPASAPLRASPAVQPRASTASYKHGYVDRGVQLGAAALPPHPCHFVHIVSAFDRPPAVRPLPLAAQRPPRAGDTLHAAVLFGLMLN